MKKTERKYKFNFVDVILILIIVLSLALMGFLMFKNNEKMPSDKDVTVTYTLRLTEISDKLRDKITPGDTVYVNDGASTIGQVVTVEYQDSSYTYYNGGDSLEVGVIPSGKIDAVVKVNGKVSVNENGEYSVGGIDIKVGSKIEFNTPDFYGIGECTAVSEESSNDVE